MMEDALKPKSIADFVFRIEDYLSTMRKMDRQAPEFVSFLKKYIYEVVEKGNLDELETKKELVRMVDGLYNEIYKFGIYDVHTEFYFALVLYELFWQLARKDFLVFFTLHNVIRDDRFKLITELYKKANFAVIHPYDCSNLVFSENHTKLPVVNDKVVYSLIDNAVANQKHILYIEKEYEPQYIKDILVEAEMLQLRYVCIFRNKSPQEDPTAHWMFGNFGTAFYGQMLK